MPQWKWSPPPICLFDENRWGWGKEKEIVTLAAFHRVDVSSSSISVITPHMAGEPEHQGSRRTSLFK